MTVLQSFTTFPPPLWSGRPRYGPLLLLPIVFCEIVAWIFIAAAFIYARVWQNNHPSGAYESPAVHWSRYRSDDLNEVFLIISIPIIDLFIHLPLHIFLYISGYIHPVTGLTLSLVFACLWLYEFAIQVVVYLAAPEHPLTGTWEALASLQSVFFFAVILLYSTYAGFSAKAVHRWRRGKKAGRSAPGEDGVEDSVELRTSWQEPAKDAEMK